MTLKHGVGLHQIDWINHNTIIHCKAPKAYRIDMLKRYDALAENRDTWLLSQHGLAFQQMAHSTEQPVFKQFQHVHRDPISHLLHVEDIHTSSEQRQLRSDEAKR